MFKKVCLIKGECGFPKLFPLQNDFFIMKLDNGKIRQICKRFDTKKVSIQLLSKQFNVSKKRIKQISKEYQETNKYPKLKKVDRPNVIMEPATKQLIKDTYFLHRKNAIILSYIIERDFNIKVSKNKVHLVLKEFGFAKYDKKKSKPRKKVRYERKHSNSLWHVDWHQIKWQDNGFIIGIIDDASRKALFFNYSSMGVENTIVAMEKAFKYFNSVPRELISDNGSEFKQLLFNKKGEINHRFQKFCLKYNIKQIFTRPSRPQTNGKIERWFGTYEQKRPLFNTDKAFLDWYNNSPHSNLNWKYRKFESPNEAYLRKMTEIDIFNQYYQKVFN
jgi:transposase